MTSFSCLILGETTLPIRCADMLLDAGHRIVGIVSPDRLVLDWAGTHRIAHAGPSNLLTFCRDLEFDLLLSIVNYSIVPPALLARARCVAINYHDALLPRYAGVYATSWAIMNRETTHGISWHVMTERVDAGDLLKQVPIEIDDTETAASLNFKCFVAAAQAFAELLEELAAGREARVPQDSSQRTYYSRHERPAGGGLISWDRPADEIDSLVRSMDFGEYRNPFAVPKILHQGRAYIALGSRMTGRPSSRPSGTVISAKDGVTTVATKTTDLELHRILSLSGAPASGDFQEGVCLETIDTDVLSRQYRTASPHEEFWAARLSSLNPLPARHGLSYEDLGRLALSHPQPYFDVGFAVDRSLSPTFFAPVVPLRISATTNVADAIEEVKGRKSFPLDLLQRIPATRGKEYALCPMVA